MSSEPLPDLTDTDVTVRILTDELAATRAALAERTQERDSARRWAMHYEGEWHWAEALLHGRWKHHAIAVTVAWVVFLVYVAVAFVPPLW